MTSAASILEVLWAQGFTVDLGENDVLLVRPARTLHESQRELLRANKPDIVEYLKSAEQQSLRLTQHLLQAAMRVCDKHGDSEAARGQMQADCLATPAHLRAELLEHFRRQA